MTASSERVFWDERVPDLEDCLLEYEDGPSPNTAALLSEVAPLGGKRVLDFACGAGVLSAWLAARGAEVIGVDISPRSVERARELSQHLGFRRVSVTTDSLDCLPAHSFDAAVGQYALHHVDLAVVAPLIHRALKPGAIGAFVETMALNPVLNMARRHLAGHGPIARYGSDDEHPLDTDHLGTLRAVFGNLTLETGEMQFLRILDRNVFKYRSEVVTRAAGYIDDWLLARGFARLSYHQVVVLRSHG